MTGPATLAGAALGVVLDRLLGEPPTPVHPVARFGQAMAALEARWWTPRRGRGGIHLLAGTGLGALAGIGLTAAVGALPATAIATAFATSGRMLGDTASSIAAPLGRGELATARARLPELVGRDPTGLDATGAARAVIESVAENTVDAVVAPLFWGALAGAPGVLAHRAVNTLDAMVGHRSPRYAAFGWASARADDAMAWIPARLAAGLVVLVRPRRAGAIVSALRAGAPHHPSPNGGVIEAAYAAALDVRLGGENRYADRVEHRGVLHPDGRTPQATDIDAAVRLLRDVTLLGATFAAAIAIAGAVRARTQARA